MKKLEVIALASMLIGTAVAMPSRQELSKTRPLVKELMAPVMVEYKAKTKTALEVADTSMGFADSAHNEATRYIFMKGAVGYYVKAGEFGKAADVVDKIKSQVKDVPPSEIVDIIGDALGRENSQRSPRLHSQLQLAQAQVKAARDVRRLAARLRQVSTDPIRCQYAEVLALGGDWKKALAEFSKVSTDVGKLAQSDADGSGGCEKLGDFWWDYKPVYEGSETIYRERAAEYYRKGIAAGGITGLKKTLVEQRLASLVPSDVDESVPASDDGGKGKPKPDVRRPVASAPSKALAKNKIGLVHRWSFADGLSDSVGGMTPSKSDNATVENGTISLRSGSPLEFPADTVPLAPFTIQVWASATDKGLGADGDFIFKIASSAEGKDETAFWTWTAGKKWVSRIGGFGDTKKVGHGKCLVDGQKHLYTVTGEKSGKGVALKFYQDDTIFGEMTTKFAWKKPPMLVLGGFASPTYDEVRVYSRALSHSEIIETLNLGPDKLPEGK